MPRENPSPRISGIERRILRALCRIANAGTAREGPWRELKNYRWHEPEHQAVYKALEGIRGHSGTPLHEYLPAQATRMGFPDLDWADYFGPPEGAAAGLRELLGELKAALRERG